ncbi:hypothetical protein H9X77_00580 [Clostridium saudiense]|nr:hypothetical protein [Clostridium saudiense]
MKDIINKKCEAAFSRQIGYKEHKVERYTREINYPEVSRVVSKNDLQKLGVMAFFFSDASSAISKEVFNKLNGYDGKDLPTNEDMYFAYKLIINGYRIKYAADSKVIHSHQLTLKQQYKRYKDIGLFFAQNSYIQKYSAGKRGKDVLIYIFKRAIEDRRFTVIFDSFLDFGVRFIGMQVGKRLNKKI